MRLTTKQLGRLGLWCVVCLASAHIAIGQTVEKIDSSQKGISFRALSAPGHNVVWVGGSKGTIGRSTDGGNSWEWKNPAGFGSRDFRDIEGFDAQTAVAMAVDSPGIIIKTTDGGKNWRVVYEDHTPGVFLDAMAFRGSEAVCVGDPADGRFWLLYSADKGDSWQLLPPQSRPKALTGEACFAASGTNIIMPEKMPAVLAMFVTGGLHARLVIVGKDGAEPNALPIPLMQGATMTGANSILALSRFPMVAGGDYTLRNRQDSAIYLMDNMLKTNEQAQSSALGYISCLAPYDRDRVVACGLNGVALYQIPDAVLTKGNTWQKIDTRSWHVAMQSTDGQWIYFAGPNGSIGKMRVQKK